ncbi:NAD(P)-dependent oxidoreductase [Paenibacillus chondroitinus]|uniref:NAD(P)-dependent oxidoreductase n=1 Tax=Paenibacillus chondroitinus TaxID=59842 RepID=A0ABU6D8X1_9BACL|nr:NAD(P)-dependent oxidoreductase [Paenibacillus chondroitinus]MCY9659667.1 NAD(P)-dependent oxidoreductase [Paenibacillus anseongense]MEB4794154.1 NAD(P)-dependent oxidoreductase [Paenibacillus chondroitinus]
MRSIEELEAKLAEPSDALIQDLAALDGDIMLLGIGGKMGPSLARLARNALKKAGVEKTIWGVSRFSESGLKEQLEQEGIHTIACDLLDDEQLQKLPDVKNIIYMAGNKFGTTGREHFTWAMNAYLPGRVAEKFKSSRIVVFSSGNIYPFTPVFQGGATESQAPSPLGEYGQSTLGRERIFEYFSRKYEIPMVIYRLNYAIDLRYGVLLEVAKAVKAGKPIDVTMGHANCIWQGDANEMALRSLNICSSPPNVLNITGPETMSMRWIAQEFGKRLGTQPVIVGHEAEDALLNNASKAFQRFGYPRVTLLQMLDWTADWVANDGATWNKDTHFQEREGKF